MPFPFVLSTTSHVTFQSSLTSCTHPSLTSAATSQRALLRATLKGHKRLSPSDQANNLSNVVSAVNGYLKYLSSLDVALSGKAIAGEEVDIALVKEIEVEWRPTLTATFIPSRENERVKGKGLDYEIYFVHHTLATVHNLIARQSLLALMTSGSLAADQRVSFVQNATKSLRTAYSIHAYLNTRFSSSDDPPSFPLNAADISPQMQSALQNLAHAELNLLGVLKDDPYPAILIQSRNKDDREWMIKAPDIPKVRTQVLKRLCIGAAERSTSAIASLKSDGKRVSKDLIEYCENLRKNCRAKACRFSALDADLSGETGKGIAWLRAGMNELGIEISADGGRTGALSKLRATWNERREDKKIEKGGINWGADGGKLEEGRILEYLDRKFTKMNDTINVQLVPDWKPLLATMPGGMAMPIDEKWKPPLLEEEELASMRAPPEREIVDNWVSSDEETDPGKRRPVGAFPGTGQDYNQGSSTSYY